MKFRKSTEWVRFLCRWVKSKMKMDKDSIAVFISILALIIAIVPFWWNDLRKTDSVEVVVLNFRIENNSQYFADMVFVNRGNTDLVIAEISMEYRIKKDNGNGNFEYLLGTGLEGTAFTPEPFTLKAGEVIAKSYKIGKAGPVPYNTLNEPHKYYVERSLRFIIVDRSGEVRISKTHVIDQKITGETSMPDMQEFPKKLTLLPAPKLELYFSFPRKSVSDESEATD